jgi:SAM-dependent methyltransferase
MFWPDRAVVLNRPAHSSVELDANSATLGPLPSPRMAPDTMTPLDDKIQQQYQGSAGRHYHTAKRSIPESAFPWIARLRARKIQPHLRPDDVVLEYGVGLGWNLASLCCHRKLGFDVGEFLAESVRQHGIEFVSNPDSLPAGAVDVVVCHHTLEHTAHPIETLSAIDRLLKPGGRLLLFVPYEKESRYRYFNPAEPNHHLYAWNVQTLGNLIQAVGFQVQSARLGRFGQERFAAVLAVRLGLGELGFRALQRLANAIKHEFEVRVIARKQ